MITRRDVAGGVGSKLVSLEKFVNEVESGARHETFPIRRNGRLIREIVRPDDDYHSVVTNLNAFFREVTHYEAPPWVHGFVRGRSTLLNAAHHVDADVLLTMDLLQFFSSIATDQVVAALKEDGFDDNAAVLCARLTTLGGALPVGLSTSPHLSNLVFVRTDAALAALAARHGLAFTRYVDDLAFSGAVPVGLVAEVTKTLNENGWLVNDAKTRLVRRGGAQYVTGLFVGAPGGPYIPRRLKRRMRWALHMIEQFGYETYATRFGEESYEQLVGIARYIAGVEPELGRATLRRLSAYAPAETDEDAFGEHWGE